MRAVSRVKPLCFVILLLLSFRVVNAQRGEDRWLRVMTGEYSTVEINRDSLTIGPDGSLSAVFKTTTTRSEDTPLGFSSGAARLDTIEFSVKENKYRILKTRSSDQNVTQPVSSDSRVASNWKTCAGRSCTTMLSAVKQLNPYGTWKVTGYHYATGQPGGPDDPEELKELNDADIWLRAESLMVGKKLCSISDFDGRTVSDSEWRSYFGSSIREFGIDSEKIQALRFTCKSGNAASPRNFLMRLDQERAILLWEGVFLDIKRVPVAFIP